MPDVPIDRWTEREFRSVNRGLVTRRRTLASLLADPDPACETREGEPHPIARDALERLAAALTPATHGTLRLPITVHFPSDQDDVGYITDPVGAEALRQAEAFREAFPYRDGRMYVPRSLAFDLINRYEGALQSLLL